MSPKYTSSFISFAKARMATQGTEIKKWSSDSNEMISNACKDIIDAAGEGVK